MAVVSINLIGAPTQSKRQGELDDTYSRIYRVWYRVVTSTPTDDPEIVLAALSYLIGTPHPIDSLALCKRLRAQETEDPQKWVVEVEYNSNVSNPADQDPDPLNEAPTVEWSGERIVQATNNDLDDSAIASSAGELFDPPYGFEYPGEVVKITRNEATFNRDLRKQLLYTVNNAPFGGYDPGQAMLTVMDGKEAYKNGVDYWVVSYEIKFDDINGFEYFRPVDRGVYYLSGGQQLMILDKKTGQAVAQPKLLDGSGNVLAVDADPVFLSFRIRDQEDWSPLNLDDLVL